MPRSDSERGVSAYEGVYECVELVQSLSADPTFGIIPSHSPSDIMLLAEWMDETPLRDLKKKYRKENGCIRDTIAKWACLFEALARYGEMKRWSEEKLSRLHAVAGRVRHGVREELLSLAPIAARTEDRKLVRLLFDAGVRSLQALMSRTPESLTEHLGARRAEKLLKIRREFPAERSKSLDQMTRSRSASKWTILLSGHAADKAKPTVVIRGEAMFLPEREFEVILLFCLALKAGRGWIRAGLVDPDPDTARRTIGRARKRLAGWLGIDPGSLIQNNRRGAYRLTLPTKEIRVDRKSLRKVFPELMREIESGLSGN